MAYNFRTGSNKIKLLKGYEWSMKVYSESFIWQQTCRVVCKRRYELVPEWRLLKRKESTLSKRNVVIGLAMEKIHFQIMLSDVSRDCKANLQHRIGAERPSTWQENVDRIMEAFYRSPQKSARRVSLQLVIPPTTVFRSADIRLHLLACKCRL